MSVEYDVGIMACNILKGPESFMWNAGRQESASTHEMGSYFGSKPDLRPGRRLA